MKWLEEVTQEIKFTEGATPAHKAQLEEVSLDVGAEDIKQQQAQVKALSGHSAEGGWERVVQQDSHVQTGIGLLTGLPLTHC